MISVRQAPNATKNEDLDNLPAKNGETNTAWLKRAGVKDGILLVGGSALADFRVRVAQSHLRRDMLPSFWSLASLLRDGMVQTVSFEAAAHVSDVPASNAVQAVEFAAFDDPGWFPNVAVISFGVDPKVIAANVERVKGQRSLIDLPRLLVPWLSYAWGAGQNVNPLLEGIGLPGAAFVETVYGLADIELTPGLSSQATCPEAIWQTAKWWRRYFEEAAGGAPTGTFVTRQPSAAVRDPA